MLLEECVGAFPRLDPHTTHLVLKSLPAEHSLLEDRFQLIVALELLLSGVLLVVLHIVGKVYSDAYAVHRAPDEVEALIHILFKEVLIQGRDVMQLDLRLARDGCFACFLVDCWFTNERSFLVKDE